MLRGERIANDQQRRNGVPATGRAELAATAAGYMEAFPDLQATLDHLHVAGDSAFSVWTLTDTNNGPDGTGNAVRVTGIEVWRIGASGLVASSTGYYDAATYEPRSPTVSTAEPPKRLSSASIEQRQPKGLTGFDDSGSKHCDRPLSLG